ncbi:hypothetical protein K438DRAFT_1957083 [Mycena galopus ATCC 62051]|nr:hypothetical protein K438DRAFT_1957083 [Mycena galopus ATCC 62051]
MEWMQREEETDKANSLVAATSNPDPVLESPVSAVHSLEDVESLHEMFPTISPATIVKIVEHEFKPINLARLNPRRCWDKFESGCSLRDTHPATAWGDVETTRIIGESGLRYVAHLIELEELYQWPAVVEYHMQFHNKRRQDMVLDEYSPWMVADRELINKLLIGRQKQLG